MEFKIKGFNNGEKGELTANQVIWRIVTCPNKENNGVLGPHLQVTSKPALIRFN